MSQNQYEWAHWHANKHGVELLEAGFVKHVYERHIHESYAVGITLSGVQRFWCRGETHNSIPGHVIAINPGDAHDGRSGTSDGYSYRMIYVPVELIRSFVQDITERSRADMSISAPLLKDPVLASQLSAAWEAMFDDSRMLAGVNLLSQALFRLSRYCGLRAPLDTHLNLGALCRVRDYLHAQVGEDVRVAELVQMAEMSRFRLTRQFERAFGLPLHAYHLQVKLEEGKRRLRSQASIARIAADLGFADQSHFHRRFKGAFGMTPDAWRRAALPHRRGPHNNPRHTGRRPLSS